MSDMVNRVGTDGTVRREEGSIKQALNAAATRLKATYQIPHISHTPMEPPNALAKVEADQCIIWAPTQHPNWIKAMVAGALEMEPTQVQVNVTLLGGAFGRKS